MHLEKAQPRGRRKGAEQQLHEAQGCSLMLAQHPGKTFLCIRSATVLEGSYHLWAQISIKQLLEHFFLTDFSVLR